MVTYNGMKWIEESIQSVLNSTLKVTVIVVDNNSSDATATFIKESFKGEDVCLIESKENLGFGKGNNLGIAQGLKKGAEYFFFTKSRCFCRNRHHRKTGRSSQ